MENSEKRNHKVEEAIAGAGGFLYAGYSIVTGGGLPSGFAGWMTFIGAFLLIMLAMYGAVYMFRLIGRR